jgi:hypothetical protein
VEVGEKPEGPFEDGVAVLSCGNDYEPGLYRVEDLSTPPYGPRTKSLPKPRSAARLPDDAAELVRQSEFVVVDPKCIDVSSAGLHEDHTLLVRRNAGKAIGAYEIWARGTVARSQRPTRNEASAPDDEDDEH